MNDDSRGLIWFEKNRHGIYTGASEDFAAAAGEDSPSQLIGKRDDDLVWRFDGNTCDRSDKLALSSQEIIRGREWINCDGGWTEVLVVKGQEQILTSPTITGSLSTTESLNAPLLNQYCEQQSFYVPYINDRLSREEMAALRNVIFRVPVQEITGVLQCCRATVNNLITKTRKKFNVKNNRDLIMALHRCGIMPLLYIIEDHNLW